MLHLITQYYYQSRASSPSFEPVLQSTAWLRHTHRPQKRP